MSKRLLSVYIHDIESDTRAAIPPILGVGVALLAYLLVFMMDLPNYVGVAITTGLPISFLGIALLLYGGFRLPGWLGSISTLFLTLVMFGLAMVSRWSVGVTTPDVLAGILPWQEAGHFYIGAQTLLDGGMLGGMGGGTAGGTAGEIALRYPLSTGFLATLLQVTGGNLRWMLALVVLITALASLFLCREIRRSHGPGAATLVWFIIFLWYRYYAGTTAAVNLALTLGAVGMAVIWRGAAREHFKTMFLGILLLTMALHAQYGAFLLLPTLLAWGAWAFRGEKRVSWRFLRGGVLAIAGGIAIHIGVMVAIGNLSQTEPFFSSPYLSQLLFQHETLSHLAQDILISLHTYIHPTGGVFLFVGESAWQLVDILLRAALTIALIWGFLRCYCYRKDLQNTLMFAATAGMFLSIPFLQPDPYSRNEAATIPIVATLTMLGATQALSLFTGKAKWQQPATEPIHTSKPLFIFAIALAAMITVGPLALKLLNEPPQFAEGVACPATEQQIYVRLTSGSLMHVVDYDGTTHPPNVRVSDLHQNIGPLTPPWAAEEIQQIDSQTTIVAAPDLQSGEAMWLVADNAMLPEEEGIVKACGTLASSPGMFSSEPGAITFFYATSIEYVPEYVSY